MNNNLDIFTKLSLNRNSFITQIESICKKEKSSIFIWGFGVYAQIIYKYLRNNGVEDTINYVIDDEYISDKTVYDDVIPLSIFLEKYSKNSPTIFGIYNYGVYLEKKEKYNNQIPYFYDLHLGYVNNEYVDWNANYVIDNIELFNETYRMLSDDRSKHTMLCYLKAALGDEFGPLFNECRDSVSYFGSYLAHQKIDVLFDCGAYDGDSAHDFIATHREYLKIYEFEPDKINIDKINSRVEKEKIRDLMIVDKGVWSSTTTLHFLSEGKSSSYVSDGGDISIDVIQLDDMFEEFPMNSLIKMDIEGSELEALNGAERIIREKRPMLAICVYHKREDLITIPQYIRNLVGEGTYSFYLGYQGFDLAELVFYAIPLKQGK